LNLEEAVPTGRRRGGDPVVGGARPP
jgi:hypothetical protein